MSLSWSYIWIPSFTLLCVIALLKRKLFPLLALPALLWQASIHLAVTVNTAEIFYGFALLGILLQKFHEETMTWTRSVIIPKREGAKVGFLFWFVLIGMLAFLMVSPPHSDVVDYARSRWQTPPWRGVLSTAKWCAQILPLFVAARWVRDPETFFKCIRILLIAMLITAMIGTLQWIGFYFFPPLQQALRFLSTDIGYGAVTYSGSGRLMSYRPSALSGEPRHFGLAMGLSAILVLLCNIFGGSYVERWMKHPTVFLLFFIMFIFSGSASAMIAVAVGACATLIWLIRQGRSEDESQLGKFIKCVAIIFILVFSIRLIDTHFGYFDRVSNYLSQIGIGDSIRGSDNLRLSFEESRTAYTAYLSWLYAKPVYLVLGAGIGNGAFYAYDYLPTLSPFRNMSFTTARIGVVDLVSDVGLVGIGIIATIWLSWWRRLTGRLKELAAEREAALLISLGMVVFLCACNLVYDVLPIIWFFFGAALGCVHTECVINNANALICKYGILEV